MGNVLHSFRNYYFNALNKSLTHRCQTQKVQRGSPWKSVSPTLESRAPTASTQKQPLLSVAHHPSWDGLHITCAHTHLHIHALTLFLSLLVSSNKAVTRLHDSVLRDGCIWTCHHWCQWHAYFQLWWIWYFSFKGSYRKHLCVDPSVLRVWAGSEGWEAKGKSASKSSLSLPLCVPPSKVSPRVGLHDQLPLGVCFSCIPITLKLHSQAFCITKSTFLKEPSL